VDSEIFERDIKYIHFLQGVDLKLQGYVVVDLTGDVNSRKSTTCFVHTLGGTTVCWTSKLQKIVTLSTTEDEYVVVIETGKEMVWLQGFLDELGKKDEKGILHSDSQSAIVLAKNSAYHSRTKHIQLRYHFICSLLESEQLTLEKIRGTKNLVDILTKCVLIEKLRLCSLLSFSWSTTLRIGGGDVLRRFAFGT
jgi:hypothetical protein